MKTARQTPQTNTTNPAPLRAGSRALDNKSAFGYASPVAAKSATGFSGLKPIGGYRHQQHQGGIFVSKTRLSSGTTGRLCGEPSGSPVRLLAGPLTRTVALFAFSGAMGVYPTKRSHTMLNLEDRLQQHTSKLAFLSDIFSQTHPIDSPGIELTEEGRSGLGFFLYDLRDESRQINTDVEAVLLNKTNKEGSHA